MLLSARDIRRTYRMGKREVEVLRGVSLDVQKGETLAIVGASGAGKSTLLYGLCGLDTPTSGAVLFNGQDIYAMKSARRAQFRADSLGFVFQSYQLMPELSVLENVLMPAMARARFAKPSKDSVGKAMELLEIVGLNDRATHRPAELSGGEQQRTAIARALMNDPELILADEPTGNLDSKTGEMVLKYLFDLIKEKQQTLLLVTHNEALADTCSRKLMLRDGLVDLNGEGE
jgi:ABC-type lipoprotein export system ATPase subunit